MGFGILIAGYFFLFFNFNVGPLNIFPDIVGYALLVWGANEVAGRISNAHFSIIKKASLLLLALGLLDLFLKNSSVMSGTVTSPTVFGRIFSVILLLTMVSLSLYFFYKLTRGIKEEALKVEETALAEKADKVFNLYCIFQVVLTGISAVTIILVENHTTVDIGGAGFFIIIPIIIFIIYLFVQVRGLLKRSNEKLEPHFPIIIKSD
ncbi:hypothetical protein [Bacillus sp. EB01]|uniref:hypothetical protein n=1 Tax=Bacillus sp. EB01 TaxID=1347086 RepID=UPI0005C49EA6|nr:hypothetical protein [Bacillus sp. EB01]